MYRASNSFFIGKFLPFRNSILVCVERLLFPPGLSVFMCGPLDLSDSNKKHGWLDNEQFFYVGLMPPSSSSSSSDVLAHRAYVCTYVHRHIQQPSYLRTRTKKKTIVKRKVMVLCLFESCVMGKNPAKIRGGGHQEGPGKSSITTVSAAVCANPTRKAAALEPRSTSASATKKKKKLLSFHCDRSQRVEKRRSYFWDYRSHPLCNICCQNWANSVGLLPVGLLKRASCTAPNGPTWDKLHLAKEGSRNGGRRSSWIWMEKQLWSIMRKNCLVVRGWGERGKSFSFLLMSGEKVSE